MRKKQSLSDTKSMESVSLVAFFDSAEVTLPKQPSKVDHFYVSCASCDKLTFRDCDFEKLTIYGNIKTLVFENTRATVVDSIVTCNELIISSDKRTCYVTFEDSFLERIENVTVSGAVFFNYQNPKKMLDIKDTLKVTNGACLCLISSGVNCKVFDCQDSSILFEDIDDKVIPTGNLSSFNYMVAIGAKNIHFDFNGTHNCYINGVKYRDLPLTFKSFHNFDSFGEEK